MFDREDKYLSVSEEAACVKTLYQCARLIILLELLPWDDISSSRMPGVSGGKYP